MASPWYEDSVVTLLQWYQDALEEASRLSESYAGKVFRVYRTPTGNYWVRQDDEPVARVDEKILVHVAGFLNGEKVRP